MSSVSDLLNMANFRIQQKQMKPDPMQQVGNIMQILSQEVEKQNQKRKQRENQKRLSGMILKDIGNLDTEYTVGETGNISAKFKPKKKIGTFASAVKTASQRIAEGEDYDLVTGEVSTEFPKLYKERTDTYLSKFIPGSTDKKLKEPLIEPRAEGFGRVGRGAKYGEAVKSYGEETSDRIIGVIQDLQKSGKSFKEISKLMNEQNINAELFLKFYR